MLLNTTTSSFHLYFKNCNSDVKFKQVILFIFTISHWCSIYTFWNSFYIYLIKMWKVHPSLLIVHFFLLIYSLCLCSIKLNIIMFMFMCCNWICHDTVCVLVMYCDSYVPYCGYLYNIIHSETWHDMLRERFDHNMTFTWSRVIRTIRS